MSKKILFLGVLVFAMVCYVPGISYSQTCCVIVGDVNDDRVVDIYDLYVLYNGVYDDAGYPVPSCAESADFNHSGAVDISDIVYLTTYLFENNALYEVDVICDL